jgi:DNA-binding CsgD family transcriptional regulator
MRLIEAALSEPASSGIVVCGSAGVGKSRIARDALAGAASRGWEVRWAVGTTAAQTLPLGALVSWAPPTGGDTRDLVRSAIDSLTSAPPDTPVVVGVDDAHLLDDMSAFVLQQIVQRSAAKLVLTVRTGDSIAASTRELWDGANFARLDLQPLSRDETAMLVSATLDGPVDPDAANRLWKLTQGNVLYLRNIVEYEVADGRLVQQNGHWRWTGDPVVPESLVELIESRMGALPPSVGEVIDALAVGEPLELAALASITDPAAVEEADTRGLIAAKPVDRRVEVRLAHPLYGEIRRRRAAPTRLRRLRGLVAAELAATDPGDDTRTVVRRAALSVDSDLDPDPDLLMRAAKGAVWLADHSLADRLADAAIRAGGAVEAYLIRGHALSWLGRSEESEKVFASVDTTELTDVDRAALAFARATTRFVGLADPTGARELIDEAVRTTPPHAHGPIDAFLMMYWGLLGKPQPAIESAKNVALDRLPDIVGAAPVVGLVRALGDAGRTTEAVRAAEAGYAIVARSLDSAGLGFVIAVSHVDALLTAGRVHEGCDVAERVRDQAANLSGGAQVMSRVVVAQAAVGAGRLRVASSVLDPVMEMVDTLGLNAIVVPIHVQRTMALAMRGLSEQAAAALAALEARRQAGWRCFDFEVELVRAWVAAAQGAVSEAIASSLSAAEIARGNGQFAPEVMCLQTAAQFGDRSGAPRLRELEAIVEGPRVGVAARFAAALRAGDGAELDAVSEEFERMGDRVAALDAAAHAAIAYRRKDLRGSALGRSTRAEALAEECGGAETPALRQASEPLPLSEREREVVMLLAEGLSSREIAERLTVSKRTVEGHIYHAMNKTGVSSREELAALLPARRTRAQK